MKTEQEIKEVINRIEFQLYQKDEIRIDRLQAWKDALLWVLDGEGLIRLKQEVK